MSEYPELWIIGTSLAGLGLAALTRAVIDRYGPSTMYAGVVADKSVDPHKEGLGRFNSPIETSAGELIDFDDTDPELMYEVLEQGQPVVVTTSDVTGTPVAVDAAGVHYDLLTSSDLVILHVFLTIVGLAAWLGAPRHWFPNVLLVCVFCVLVVIL